ncbi:MAG TPA: phosphate ABC transporter permease subunit PstC, partial [Pseudoxanthomonas sp.]|nr:phosphate ABC transporter permease subunit PstC [Pseudoxanthomonas sp.]
STIANEFAEATDPLHKGSLLLGFTLFLLTFIVLAIARLMLRQLAKREGN